MGKELVLNWERYFELLTNVLGDADAAGYFLMGVQQGMKVTLTNPEIAEASLLEFPAEGGELSMKMSLDRIRRMVGELKDGPVH